MNQNDFLFDLKDKNVFDRIAERFKPNTISKLLKRNDMKMSSKIIKSLKRRIENSGKSRY